MRKAKKQLPPNRKDGWPGIKNILAVLGMVLVGSAIYDSTRTPYRRGKRVLLRVRKRQPQTVPTGDSDTKPQAISVSAEGGYEKSDFYLPGLMVFLVIIFFGAFAIHAGLWGWLNSLKGRSVGTEGGHWSTREKALPTTFPKLQINPETDWHSYRNEQEKQLHSYGWVDKKAGIIRIPIEEAMKQVASKGVPHWGSANRVISPLQLQQERAGKGGPRNQ